jgi:hypothetical protein
LLFNLAGNVCLHVLHRAGKFDKSDASHKPSAAPRESIKLRISAEMSLNALAYNLKRVMKTIGANSLMKTLSTWKKPVLIHPKDCKTSLTDCYNSWLRSGDRSTNEHRCSNSVSM